jgi:hypothetical protein
MPVRARAIIAVALVLLLMATSTGCLSVFATKDALIFKKESARVEYHKVKPVTFYWAANKIIGDDLEEPPRNILVKPGTKYLQLTVTAVIVSSVVTRGAGLPDAHFDLRLRTPTGDVWGEFNYTESADDTAPVQGPSAGLWVLSMEGMGYGIESSGIQDSLHVEVELYEPK